MTFLFFRCPMTCTRSTLVNHTLHASANGLCKMYRCFPSQHLPRFLINQIHLGHDSTILNALRSEVEPWQMIDKD
ncbi:hypothetical protein TNCV_1815101 [Trichonephila clavipes]|nr:hypothetical protein TNCV_1815101 [Trichonephila clavipes]